jgi:putative ABC transport system permease protein
MRQEFWFALRRLRRRPAHSALVITTLGIGLGAALAVFSLVDAILLRPLPFPDANRLVAVAQVAPTTTLGDLSISGITYLRIAQARALESVAAYTTRDANLVQSNRTQRLIVAQVTGSFFTVLGVAPERGRAFTPEEDLPNGPRALVISDALWRSAFSADSAVIGKVADLEGESFTIVGVAPRSMGFPSRAVHAWEPLRLPPTILDPNQNRHSLIARLRPGVSTATAHSEVTDIIQAVGREFPGPHPGSALDPSGYQASIRPLGAFVAGDSRPVVLLLSGGVLMLLLLTCANVANLQLASVITRGEEFAARAAMGATRSRIVFGALIEGVLLSGAGAIVGLVIAMLGAGLLLRLLPPSVVLHGSAISGPVVLVAALAVIVIGTIVGALPVAVVAGRDPALALRDRASGATPRVAGRVRRVLAAAQVAMAVLLLQDAGLLIASAREVQRVQLGFRPDSTMSLRVNLPAPTMRDRGAREALLRRLISDVSALPSVASVGLVNALPLERGRRDIGMAVEGRPFKADGTDPLADYRVTSAGYFEAMGIRVRKGRVYTDDDASATNTPIVISAALERRLFPNGDDPIGQRLKFGPVSPWMPIIGVVEDAKNRSLTEESRPELYTPGLGTFSNMAFRSELTIVARARGDASSLAAPIVRIVEEAAPDVATFNVASLADIIRDARSRMTTATQLMFSYALAALLLAVAGTYALLSYFVNQRRHEIAVRVALGADTREVVRLVAREWGVVVGVGAIAGLLAAVLSARLLAGLLYGVGTLNPVVAGLVLVSAGVAALAAGIVPARRAANVDPVVALRSGG